MARNYMLDFIQGYGFVNDINRQKRLDEERADDRAFNRRVAEQGLSIQNEQNERSRQTFDMQKAEYDQAVADRNSKRDAYVKMAESMFGPEVAANPEAVQKITGLVSDPERTGEAMAVWDNVQRYFDNGKTPQSADVSQFMNLAGKEELAARGGNDGLGRAVRAVVPSPDGKGLMFDFNVTGQAGKTYTAPMTKQAKTAGQGDDIVDSRSLDQVMSWGVGAASTMRRIAIELAKAGDNSIIEAYKAAKQKMAERVAGREDYIWKKEADKKYETPEFGTIGDAKTGIFSFDKRTGKRGEQLVPAASGINDGKSQPITLKTGQVVTLDDARQAYLATYGKPDGMGGFTIGQDAPPFTAWMNAQAAKPVFDAESSAPKVAIGENYPEPNPGWTKWTSNNEETAMMVANDLSSGARPEDITDALLQKGWSASDTKDITNRAAKIQGGGQGQVSGGQATAVSSPLPADKSQQDANPAFRFFTSGGQAKAVTPEHKPTRTLADLNTLREKAHQASANYKGAKEGLQEQRRVEDKEKAIADAKSLSAGGIRRKFAELFGRQPDEGMSTEEIRRKVLFQLAKGDK